MMLRLASNRPSSAASACSTASDSSPHCHGASQTGTTPDRTPDSRFPLRLRDPGGHDTARATQVDKVGEAAALHVDNGLAPRPLTCAGTNTRRTGPPVGRRTRRSVTRTRPRVDALSPARTDLWGAAAAPSEPLTSRAVLMPGAASSCCSSTVGRTPGISCEAVPASEMVRRGHPAAPPSNHGADGSFVSFIPLFGSVARLSSSSAGPRQ